MAVMLLCDRSRRCRELGSAAEAIRTARTEVEEIRNLSVLG